MRDDGVKRALAFFTSAFSSYSGCRQYRENIAAAQAEVGEGCAADRQAARVLQSSRLYRADDRSDVAAALRAGAAERARCGLKLLFTAHSIPLAMADNCRYEHQLREACRLVAEGAGMRTGSWFIRAAAARRRSPGWSRISARRLRRAAAGTPAIVVVPIGFISDHMEVLYDLDTEAAAIWQRTGHFNWSGRHGRHASAFCRHDSRIGR